MSNTTERSPWVYVGCGCALIVVLIVIAIAGASFVGVRKIQEYTEGMKDPVARAERTLEVLGGDTLPAGYNAQLYLSVPFVLDLALLTDGPPVTEDDSEGLKEFRNLIFFLDVREFDESRDFSRYLDGEIDRPAIFNQIDVDFDFDPGESIGRGSFELGDQRFRWVAESGDLETDLTEHQGILVLSGVDCPRPDKRVRILAWFQRHDDLDLEALRADPTGTPADEVAFREIVGNFDVCAN